MKKNLLIIAAALAFSVCAFAQGYGQRPQGQRPDEATMIKMRTDRMVQQLGLDEAQAEKLLELNKKYPTAMFGRPGGPGMGGPGPGPGMGRPPRGGQRPDQDMTQGQDQAKDQENKADGKKDKKSRKNKKGGKPEKANVQAQSEGQAQPEGGRPERGRPELTEEQKKAFEEARAAREAYEAGLKEILTEEQFKTWQESRNRRPQGRPF